MFTQETICNASVLYGCQVYTCHTQIIEVRIIYVPPCMYHTECLIINNTKFYWNWNNMVTSSITTMPATAQVYQDRRRIFLDHWHLHSLPCNLHGSISHMLLPPNLSHHYSLVYPFSFFTGWVTDRAVPDIDGADDKVDAFDAADDMDGKDGWWSWWRWSCRWWGHTTACIRVVAAFIQCSCNAFPPFSPSASFSAFLFLSFSLQLLPLLYFELLLLLAFLQLIQAPSLH